MAHQSAIRVLYQFLIVLGLFNIGILATTCPGFPGYCSESFPGHTCVVVCSRGRPNVPLCQEDGTWTDIPRCIEHDPGVEEQIPGLCPAIPGYCSDGYLGQQCKFTCSFGPNIDSSCSQDGTWEPYPTCQGDIRDTQDGCDGCPGRFGGKRNRTAEQILGITQAPKSRPPTDERAVRPSFAGSVAFGPINEKPKAFAPNFDVNPQSRVPRVQSLPVQTANAIATTPKSFIPPQRQQFGGNSNFVPNLAEAGLRSQTSPATTPAPRIIPTPRPIAQPPRSNTQPRSQFSRPQTQQFPQRPQTQQQFPRSQQQFPRNQQFPGNQRFQQNQQQFPRTQQFQGTQQRFPGTQQQFPRTQQQQPRGGFTSQQLDIIKNGITRLQGFGGQQQPQQNRLPTQQPTRPVQQQQPTRPVTQQQPRRPVPQQQPTRPVTQQQPRRPVPQPSRPVTQQQPRRPAPQPTSPVTQQPRRPAPQPTRPVTQTPRRLPPQQPAARPSEPIQKPAPAPAQETVQLSDLQKSILAAAGITNIPKSIPKVKTVDESEPRVVDFLVKDEPKQTRTPLETNGEFFGPLEVIDLQNINQAGIPPELNLQAFPAIPGNLGGGPQVLGPQDPAFGPFQVIDL